MGKIIKLVIVLSFVSTSIIGQEINTIGVTDWNLMRKSAFVQANPTGTKNSPSIHGYYWGINIGHISNTNDMTIPYHYNGQLAFGANYKVNYPDVYVRSTYINGEGIWAKLVHSKGNHAIDGKLTVKEVEVKVNTGADFVFSPDYRLKPLGEVEAFVRENRHLPDIPSEKEMKENGLNLNDMQISLLQKIEELTLYMIDLKNENEKIKKENEALELRIDRLENK